MPKFNYVRNASVLLSHGNRRLREDALSILDHVLEQTNPYIACRREFRKLDGALSIQGTRLPLLPGARVWFFGAGKASLQIARAVEEVLGDLLCGGLLICKEGQRAELRHVDIMFASHPVPSPASVAAAEEIVRRIALPKAGDVVIFGITGGSSALMALPERELALADIQRLTEVLLTCGADIFEINAVRKHLSRIGGGRLAQMLDPDTLVVNLTVSDVIGDRLDYLTDPTVPDTSSIADARATLDKYDLWGRIPEGVSRFLGPAGAVKETAKALPKPRRQDVLLLPSAAACEAARLKAQALGYATTILSSCFGGESQALGQNFAAIAREIVLHERPLKPPCAIIGGGETIVTMSKFGGTGGPNQEFALNGARYLPEGDRTVLLGADTDGTDGPTQVAGALCDEFTIAEAQRSGINVADALERHDVTPVLAKLHDAIVTGATGTNVNDLKLLLVRPQ
jgi:glycerate 2-kinase